MKITIPAMTVEVDAKSWAEEYGVDPKDVRSDVIEYFTSGAHPQNQIEALGLGPETEE
ncbi:MAG: hypothetical protein ACPF8W_03070 [Luminiphilus sp.]